MQITKNFKSREFKCPTCGNTAYQDKMIDRLQILRNLMGVSIRVTSGYRCKSHNTKVKGSTNSLHMKGLAADIQVAKNKHEDLKRYANLVFHDSGVGYYSNHVHVDLGPYKRFNGTY